MDLITSKYQKPKSYEAFVHDETTIATLKTYPTFSLTVLEGVHASGKSTLVSMCVRESLWLTLDATLNDVDIFWHYVFGMFGTAAPISVSELANTLNHGPEVTLVFDDFHVIQNPDILETFNYFIHQLLDHVHIIVITQPHPLFAYSTFAAKRGLLKLDAAMFVLGDTQAEHYLRHVLAHSDDIQEIIQQAEGWLGGLNLLVSENRSRLVRQYFDTVLNCVNDEGIAFLRKSAHMAYFNDALLQMSKDNFAAIIRQLERANVLFSFNEGHGRYHSLWCTYLRETFNDVDHQSIAQQYFAYGDEHEAIEHLFKVSDYVGIMEHVLALPQNEETFEYIRRVPVSAIVDNFAFAYQKMFYHYANLDFDICADILKVARVKGESDYQFASFNGLEALLRPTIEKERVDVARVEGDDATRDLVAIRNAAMCYYQDDYHQALKLLKAVVFDENPYTTFYVLNICAQSYEELGYLNLANQIFAQMRRFIETANMLEFVSVSYNISLVGVYLKQGRLEEGRAILDEVVGHGTNAFVNLEMAYDFNHIEYLYAKGRYDEGYDAFARLMPHGQREGWVAYAGLLRHPLKHRQLPDTIINQFVKDYRDVEFHVMASHLLMARIEFIKGDIGEALAIVDTVLSKSRSDTNYLKIVEAALLKMQMITDERESIALYKEALYYGSDDYIVQPFLIEQDVVANLHQTYGDKLTIDASEKMVRFHDELLILLGVERESLLTPRELEVLEGLNEGLSNKEIAARLVISLPTVKTHIVNIYRKLNANSRILAVQKAQQLNIL